MATSKLDWIDLHVVEIIPRNYITPIIARKLGSIHLYVVQIKFGNYINTPHATKKLGCIHLYVVQIKFEIVSAPHGSKDVGCIHLYVV
jgi:hypothetical protein